MVGGSPSIRAMQTSVDKREPPHPPHGHAHCDDRDKADQTPSETTPLVHSDARHKTRNAPSSYLGGLSTAKFWLVFSQILAVQFLCFFDTNVMVSAHPVITSHLGAAHLASWLSTSFTLTSTVSQPLLGRLSDALGRKPLFLGTLATLAAATLWCALAPSIESLIAARALCGLGAGGAMLMGSIAMGDMIPVEYAKQTLPPNGVVLITGKQVPKLLLVAYKHRGRPRLRLGCDVWRRHCRDDRLAMDVWCTDSAASDMPGGFVHGDPRQAGHAWGEGVASPGYERV